MFTSNVENRENPISSPGQPLHCDAEPLQSFFPARPQWDGHHLCLSLSLSYVLSCEVRSDKKNRKNLLLNSNQQDWHLAKEVSGGCLTLIRRELFCLEVEESHPGKHENREKDALHGAKGILML